MTAQRRSFCFRKRQRGVSLLDAALWSALAIAVTIGGMWVKVQDLRIAKAHQQGEDLAQKAAGLDNYMTQHNAAIMNNVPVAGVANVRAPTMAELTTLGFLPAGGTAANFYGGSYITRINLVPAACVPPNCNLEGWVIMNSPVLDGNGAPSELLASYAAQKAGADGGYSSSGAGTDAANITGMNGAWNTPNPFGPVGARTRGIVASHVFTGTSSLSAFLRRDGSDAGMSGALKMNNNNITGANQINATTMTGTTVNGTTINGTTVNGTTMNATTVNGTTVNGTQVVANRVSASEVVASGQHVLATWDVSSVNGNIIARTGNVEARSGNLVARNGWTIADDGVVENARLPNGINPRLSQAVFYSHVMPSGNWVAKPTCPAGSVPQVFGTSVSKATNPPRAIYGEYIGTGDWGWAWVLTQYLLTSAGWQVANPANSFIKVDVKCS